MKPKPRDIKKYIRQCWDAPARHLEFMAKLVAVPKDQRTGQWWLQWDRLVRKSQEGKGMTAALCGPGGVGKTQMAVALMCQYAYAERDSFFITADRMFNKLKDIYRTKTTSWTGTSMLEAYSDLRKWKLLVIDEFGRHDLTKSDHAFFFEILNQRYVDMSDTVILSNLSHEEFRNKVGPHMVRRMEEAGLIIDATWTLPKLP